MGKRTRRPHKLSTPSRVTRPGALLFLSVSTLQHQVAPGRVEHTLNRACGLYQRLPDESHTYNPWILETSEPAELWSWIDDRARPRTRLLCISPEPIKALTVLDHVEHTRRLGYELSHPIASNRLVIIPYRKDTKVVTFISHTNIFPDPFAEAATPRETAEAMRDFYLEYIEMLDAYNLGSFAVTTGSQALTTYRHRFMQHPIYCHCIPTVDDLENRSTLGACYRPLFVGRAPTDDYYYLDTNAMYPWAMAAHELPYSYVNMVGRLPLETLADKLERFGVVATVKLHTDLPVYPTKHDKRTVFPTGVFVTTLTTPDLRFALDHGHLVECYRTAWYKTAILFSDYVAFMWRLRKLYGELGKPELSALSKAWSVSLYGKFGGRRYKVEELDAWENAGIGHGVYIDAETLEQAEYTTLGGKMWLSKKSGLSTHSFPAIMAHVAAYGRRRLFDLQAEAGEGNTFFLMSDGLVVNRAGYEALEHEIDTETLGALKIKHHARKLHIYSDTEVVLGQLVRRPGVRADAVCVSDGVFLEQKDPGLPTILSSGQPGRYITSASTRKLERKVKTGIVQPGGWVAPLHLED